MNKEKNFISAVVYVHNAENRVADFIKAVADELGRNFEHSEIICVNDASCDGSLKCIKEASKTINDSTLSVINMSHFHGLELSMNAGVDLAIGDFVFEFDNTLLDFDTSVIMKTYHRSLEGFDIVSASSDRRERLTSQLFYYVFDRFTEMSYKISTESFRILSRRVINRIGSMNRVIPYRKAIYANCGLKTDSIKYKASASGNIRADRLERRYRSALAVDSLLLFTEFGYKFSMSMTFVMMFMSTFMVAYSFFTYLLAHPVAGWTTTILFLSVSFFGLFGILTIIVKYLQLSVDMAFKKKRYSFESIEKLTD